MRSLTVTFLEMWNAVSEKDENDTDFSKFLAEYSYEAQQTGFIQPYADSPLDNEQVGEEVYISMVNKAEKYCWFMTPYLIITDEMAHALTLAAKRGVDVRDVYKRQGKRYRISRLCNWSWMCADRRYRPWYW